MCTACMCGCPFVVFNYVFTFSRCFTLTLKFKHFESHPKKNFIEVNILNTVAYSDYFQAEKRAHHNALERKRRDHIKDSFTALRDAVPSLQGEKVVSVSSFAIHFILFLYLGALSLAHSFFFTLCRGAIWNSKVFGNSKFIEISIRGFWCLCLSYCLFVYFCSCPRSTVTCCRRVERKFWKKPPNTLHSWSEKIKPTNRATMIWNGKTINWTCKVSSHSHIYYWRICKMNELAGQSSDHCGIVVFYRTLRST